MTEEQIFRKFLESFQVGSAEVDDTVMLLSLICCSRFHSKM